MTISTKLVVRILILILLACWVLNLAVELEFVRFSDSLKAASITCFAASLSTFVFAQRWQSKVVPFFVFTLGVALSFGEQGFGLHAPLIKLGSVIASSLIIIESIVWFIRSQNKSL